MLVLHVLVYYHKDFRHFQHTSYSEYTPSIKYFSYGEYCDFCSTCGRNTPSTEIITALAADILRVLGV